MPHDDDDGSGGFGRAPSNPVADTGGGVSIMLDTVAMLSGVML
jgi:hypothetical protein